MTGSETDSCHWIAMDIDYPAISWSGSTPRYAVARRLAACDDRGRWLGHGVLPIRRRMAKPGCSRLVVEVSLACGAAGLAMFAEMALKHVERQPPVEPLYLRLPMPKYPARSTRAERRRARRGRMDAARTGRYRAETAVGAIRALEVELFGNHAWSEASIRQELYAGTRRRLRRGRGGWAHAASAIRGFAGYWYDGDDAEIMDIGVSKTHQRQGIASR